MTFKQKNRIFNAIIFIVALATLAYSIVIFKYAK